MPVIKLEIFIKAKYSEKIADSLRIDDDIGRKDVYIKVDATGDGVHYIIKSYKFNIGFVKNTFNDIIICLKPLLDILGK